MQPGLLILHGNRLELLAEAVFQWLAATPPAPLQEEVFLVQSNGMAEWLKMQLASAHGICAATRVELPARFVWRAYRAVLGRAAVPAVSALDKLPLTWRLMGLLPRLAGTPGFAPVAGFLQADAGDALRRLQLAQRLADLFDQYQVYRSHWLHDWAAGHDVLRPSAEHALAGAPPVPADQAWQPALWRAALAGLSAAEQQATRPLLHQRFLQALATPGAPSRWPLLPRRVVLFGTTHIPHQLLEAVAALAGHGQVLLAVPNPCRFHWADTIDGRELLLARQRRHPLRQGLDLAAVPLEQMHAHGHPLLAAWGRQSRDFVRQLDAFDDVQQAQARFNVPRVDLFDEAEGDGGTLLQQVQARIRDLVPLAEHAPAPPLAADDRSVVFHIAHSAQREVEILHDQLLHLLAHPPGGAPLAPRDIVVMVPDVDAFAPAIRSVFGQHPRGHARHIPWGLADQRLRGHQPLLVALEWLLNAPHQRFTSSQLRDLLDVPAVARRLGLDADALPTLVQWIAGAGVRWGLHAAQRQQLGLGACGEANTWRFGLQRMLLGYATGALDEGFADIQPHAEVAGLDAGLAGTLAELLDRLDAWWADAATPRPPNAWGERLRALLQALFAATDPADQALLAALDDALAAWLQACQAAGFTEPVALPAVREAWLDTLDLPGGGQRFRAGGVTFCTLLPLRAIPFEVVCLLGMNDGDYPRRGARSDFDLMALPGQARPGDRSRRDDDRQLMLDALLSARRVLYISWAGRSQRDNQLQPPSVLVSQLRDYLAAGWGDGVLPPRTTEHPLQPFSRRYFQPPSADSAAPPGDAALITYASEWRAAHAPQALPQAPAAGAVVAELPALTLDVAALAQFLRNPVKAFFAHRLQVRLPEQAPPDPDDEPFATQGLDRWQLLEEALAGVRQGQDRAGAAAPEAPALALRVQGQVARLQRAGRLPLGGPGRLAQDDLARTLSPMLARWLQVLAQHPLRLPRLALALQDAEMPGLRLADWLVDVLAPPLGPPPASVVDLVPGRLLAAKGKPRPDRLLTAWVRGLAAAAQGQPVSSLLIGTDAVVHAEAPPAGTARDTLLDLMRAAHQGLRGQAPLPTALATGLAWLAKPDSARAVYEGGSYSRVPAEGHEPCLSRLYPDFDSLRDAPGFDTASRRLYAPFRAWLESALRVQPLAESDSDADADDDAGDDGFDDD